jgi:nucleoid-associated protein EbfC
MPMPPNLNKMLEQLQQDMEAAQAKLKDERVESSAGGGMVKAVVTGEGRLESIAIDPDAVDPEDVELLQDMVMAAVNEALRQADDLREKATSGAAGFDPMEMLGGLGLGGPGGLPGGLGGGMPGGGAANRAARRKKK